LQTRNLFCHQTKKGLLVVIIASIVLALFFVNNTPVKAEDYNVTINYNYYYPLFSEGKMDTTGSIYWSYITSNYVDLEVWILDDSNYDIYESGGTATGYPVSEYVNYFDSGTFNIPYEDKWYIIFINADNLHLSSTTASITVTFNGVKTFSDQQAIIIAVVAGVVITAIAVPVSIANKKKKAQAASQQTPINQQPISIIQEPTTYTQVQPIQTQPIQKQQPKTKYCPHCGNENKSESHFCAYCGASM